MALPKIDVPTYELDLPLSKKKIKYRPFLVKEQRNLLMAMESDDSTAAHNSIRDILINCTLTDVDIDKLPIIDIEYYFLNLRAKSVGEIVDLKYRCNNPVNGDLCNGLMETKLNLLNVKIQQNEITPEIQLTDKMVMKLKYPEFGIVKDSVKYEEISALTFHMIAKSVEYIYDGEQFYYANEVTEEEMVEFIENLNQQQFEKIENFFTNLPQMKEKIRMKCPKCNFDHSFDVQGLESFFG
jgi:T4 bacteriophage base plate protein